MKRLTFRRWIGSIFTAAVAVAVVGCADPQTDISALMWYRKPAKPRPKGHTLSVDRIGNPSAVDIGNTPRGAGEFPEPGLSIKPGGGRLDVGTVRQSAEAEGGPWARSSAGPNVSGGVTTAITGSSLQPSDPVGSTLSIATDR